MIKKEIERVKQLNDKLGTIQLISPETIRRTFSKQTEESFYIELPNNSMNIE